MESTNQLVTVDEALIHLRVTDVNEYVDVEMKLQQAIGIILDYLGAQADAAWTAATVPAPVHAAILLQTAHLYAFRGDDLSDRADDHLAPGVRRVLLRSRDPAVS